MKRGEEFTARNARARLRAGANPRFAGVGRPRTRPGESAARCYIGPMNAIRNPLICSIAALVAAAAAACTSAPARTYGEKLEGGRYTRDGVELPHSRWVPLRGALSGAAAMFTYQTGVGDIELSGADGDDAAIEVLVFETAPNDADLQIKNGRIEVTTKSRVPAGLAHVRGKLPSRAALQLAAQNGLIDVKNFKTAGDIQLGTTGGEIRAASLHCGQLNISTVSGAATARACEARGGRVATDRGPLQWIECHYLGDLVLRSVSAPVEIHKGDYTILRVETADANITFANCRIVSAEASTASGNISARGAQFTKTPRLQSARGAITQE